MNNCQYRESRCFGHTLALVQNSEPSNAMELCELMYTYGTDVYLCIHQLSLLICIKCMVHCFELSRLIAKISIPNESHSPSPECFLVGLNQSQRSQTKDKFGHYVLIYLQLSLSKFTLELA